MNSSLLAAILREADRIEDYARKNAFYSLPLIRNCCYRISAVVEEASRQQEAERKRERSWASAISRGLLWLGLVKAVEIVVWLLSVTLA